MAGNVNCPMYSLCNHCNSAPSLTNCWHYDAPPKVEDGKITLSIHDEVIYEFENTLANRCAITERNKFCQRCANNHCVDCVVLNFIKFLNEEG